MRRVVRAANNRLQLTAGSEFLGEAQWPDTFWQGVGFVSPPNKFADAANSHFPPRMSIDESGPKRTFISCCNAALRQDNGTM